MRAAPLDPSDRRAFPPAPPPCAGRRRSRSRSVAAGAAFFFSLLLAAGDRAAATGGDDSAVAQARPDLAAYLRPAVAETVACLRRAPDLPPGMAHPCVARTLPGAGYEVELEFPGGPDRAAITYRLVAEPDGRLFLSGLTFRAASGAGDGEATACAVRPPVCLSLPEWPLEEERSSLHTIVFPAPADGEPETQPCRAAVTRARGPLETPEGSWPDVWSVRLRLVFPERAADDLLEDRTETLAFARGEGFVHRLLSVDPESTADDETLTRAAPGHAPPPPAKE